MTLVPETNRNADWPRKVAQSANKATRQIGELKEAAPSRAALWFFR